MKIIILLLFTINIYAIDLPLITVEANKYIPYTCNIKGKDLLQNFDNSFESKVILLACYIHTQSIGKKDMTSLADKYGVAQCIKNRLDYNYRDINRLDIYLKTQSSTIKNNLSNYFWVDSKEYYSQQCLIASYNVLKGNIPKVFDIGYCTSFLNEKKVKSKSKVTHVKVKKFIHTFYISKRFMKKIIKIKKETLRYKIVKGKVYFTIKKSKANR